ncbi:hypothetical protein LSH36_1023g02076 [Paralvinella palmiformis]|uniref:Uncharacterized protein n=1 Tax=Paralvinella palmiformis TaxID=53620 RepID=A0AAD9IVU7_9ANNE|nr:hypothetical protein LSH36_1023g02076 [Paralvinella palmiformis]
MLLCLFPWLLINVARGQFMADGYWNGRYSGKLNYVDYTSDDVSNGLWSDSGSLRGPYLLSSGEYSGSKCTGCVCDDNNQIVSSCTGPAVSLLGHSFINITEETFTNPSAVTSIKILNNPNFNLIGNGTFLSLVNLEYLNLAKNALEITTFNWIPQTLPTSLTRVALMENNIHWLPDDMFSGTSVTILSLSYNQFTFLPQKALTDMTQLLYL